MQDAAVPISKVAAMGAWSVAAILFVVTWVLVANGSRWAHVMSYSSIVVCIVAATLQVRCWVVRVCALLRATAGLDGEGSNLHAIR